jgi:short-subunit dehydrogenase
VRRDLHGRVAFITGASAGIGAACGRALAARGVRVVLAARRLDRLHRLSAEIEHRGGRALPLQVDVSHEDQVESAIRTSLETFGRLDIVVANAGIGFIGAVHETPGAVARRLVDVNLLGSFYTARTAVPILKSQGTGHLLFVSSIVGHRGIQYTGAYCATKAGQIGLAEALRAELAGSGVDVSVVLPVSTRTEFLDAIARDFGRRVRGVGPQQTAERVAEAIVATIRRPRFEVYPYVPARALPLLNALSPEICGWVLRKFGRKRDD